MPFCQEKIDKFQKPQWFHQLTPAQTSVLDELPLALSNDIAESCITRTSSVIKRLHLFPAPSTALIGSAIRNADGSGVLLLENLRSRLKSSGNGFGYNDKLLMSSVCHCELPLFLNCLASTLNKRSSPSPTKYQKNISENRREKKPSKPGNPYRQPVWVNQPDDWLARRNAAAKKAARAPRRYMLPPDALARSSSLSHVHNQTLEEEARPVCHVLQFFNDEAGQPLDISKISEDLRHFSDITDALSGVTKYLVERGMVCCGYPQFVLHPVIQQFVKHYNGEVLTHETKQGVLAACEAAQKCIRQMYTIPPPLPVPLYNIPDSSWQHIEHIKLSARDRRRAVLNHLFDSRYKASQNFARSLQPEFKMVDGFLPAFAAYTINSHTNMTVWPLKNIYK